MYLLLSETGENLGWVYYVSRILLIILAGGAALVAKSNQRGNATAILAGIVSIGTGIETALKPASKHKSHFVYTDSYIQFRLLALNVDPNDSKAVNALLKDKAQLDAKYQQEQF